MTAPPLTNADLARMDDDTLRAMCTEHARQAAEYERCGWSKDAAVQRGRMDRALDEMVRRSAATDLQHRPDQRQQEASRTEQERTA